MFIYLVRHGEDTPGYRGGWSQFGLTDFGKMQIKDFALDFKAHQYHIDYIISSDLNRTKESAEIVSKVLHKNIIFNPLWREYNNGLLAGLKNEEADKLYPGLYFSTIGMNEAFPNGETPQDYFNRIQKALLQVKKENKDVLIITHGGVMDVIRHILENKTWSNSSPDKIHYNEAQMIKFEI